ncbi:hypothetical protein SAMN05878443_0117 [Carnobacterium alterfunditum]|uniref:HrgC protein n=1 Tax=Carnobacterium alterfunditum TaxID=28230 RepID=A0A1N6EPH1_9LACT|nr:hypothetical protein [Carnobacterium alterfunditum]SIN84870.1 hypothetical protein SAMN05878443_0117 [Carnobacterium alterfunditum]
MKVSLTNPHTRQIKHAKIGFSWTTLFFAFIPALFRGDMKWFFIQLVCFALSLDLSSLIFAFIYNKLYINSLLEKGYVPADKHSAKILSHKGYIVPN